MNTGNITDTITHSIPDVITDTIGEVGSVLESVPDLISDGISSGVDEGRRLARRMRLPSFGRTRSASRRWWIVVGALALVGAVASVAWYRSRSNDTADQTDVADLDSHRSVA